MYSLAKEIHDLLKCQTVQESASEDLQKQILDNAILLIEEAKELKEEAQKAQPDCVEVVGSICKGEGCSGGEKRGLVSTIAAEWEHWSRKLQSEQSKKNLFALRCPSLCVALKRDRILRRK